MEGARTGPDRGIIPRAVEDMFACIETDTAPGSKYLVRASYLQIYNEVSMRRQSPALLHRPSASRESN
jgi:kinesin family protein 3/17